MKFCPLCYGSVEVVEDSHVCKRCGSVFDTQGELVKQHNVHMAKAVAESPLIVTRGDGVPLPDQNAALEAFKAQCLKPALPSDTQIVDWLESMHNLHTDVVASYLVDRYNVELRYDDEVVYDFDGDTLREAYAQAMQYRYNKDSRSFVRYGNET